MFRWEKQTGGNFYAYSGQVVIGMCVKMSEKVQRDDGRTHVWNLTAVSGRSWLKTRGHTKAMATAKRSLKRCWTDWCEVHGLTYEKKLAGVEGIESSSSVLETDALPLS